MLREPSPAPHLHHLSTQSSFSLALSSDKCVTSDCTNTTLCCVESETLEQTEMLCSSTFWAEMNHTGTAAVLYCKCYNPGSVAA